MSPERDEPTDEQDELYEEVPPRSIFAAPWFRVLLVLIVLGVVGAVAVPYVLDWMNPPPPTQIEALRPPPPPAGAPSVTPAPPSAPPSGTPAAPAPTAPTPPATVAQATRPPASTVEPPKAMPPAAPRPAPTPPRPAAPKPEAKAAPTPAGADTKKPAARSPVARATAGGPFWVQVGAFKDQQAAGRLAAKLREQNFTVEESSVTRAGDAAAAPAAARVAAGKAAGAPTDQYDVFVTGPSAAELNQRLTAKGLAAETSGTGALIRPSLPLRDAVALSKDLAADGFKVQVRRAATGESAAAPPAATAPAAGAETLHRVRVGSFADRAAAATALKDLEAKGYKGFIARGGS